MTLRRSERNRDAVPSAAPTLRTIDPTRRRTCIFRLLGRKNHCTGHVVIF